MDILNILYHVALLILIIVSFWAVISKRVKDRLSLLIGVILIGISSASMLGANTEHAHKIFVIGCSVLAVRCFYIKNRRFRGGI